MSHLENLSKLQKRMPSPDYRCRNEVHPGKIPSVWEVSHKCIQCPYLMTREDFDVWCRHRKVFFIGG